MDVTSFTTKARMLALSASVLLLQGCLMNEEAESQTVETSIAAVNSPPTISGTPPAVVEVGVNYVFTPVAADADRNTLTFSIVNLPGWLSFDSSTGRLSGVPFLGNEGTYNDIVIAVSDGTVTTPLSAFSITVEPASATNMPPEISGTAPSNATVGSAYIFAPSASDPDGDSLAFNILNAPSWSQLDAGTGRLSGTPQSGNEGTYSNIIISVTDGQLSTELPAFSITVESASSGNMPPEISGTAPSNATVGSAYVFTPSASDPDGDSLAFNILNAPSWSQLDAGTGRLSGTPQSGDEGTYSDIIISVTDGQLSTELPAFSVTVESAPAGNTPPQISGTAPTDATVGEAYTFIPSASDPDGDSLSFEIQNAPSWTQFDTSTGSLNGTPQVGDVGTYSNIVISVSDGQASAELPAFAITVSDQVALGSITLSWTPPTQNTDGTLLEDLAGYRIYYGTSTGNYPNRILLDDQPGISSYVLDNLVAGTYYIVSTAINDQGIESDHSNEAVIAVTP